MVVGLYRGRAVADDPLSKKEESIPATQNVGGPAAAEERVAAATAEPTHPSRNLGRRELVRRAYRRASQPTAAVRRAGIILFIINKLSHQLSLHGYWQPP